MSRKSEMLKLENCFIISEREEELLKSKQASFVTNLIKKKCFISHGFCSINYCIFRER